MLSASTDVEELAKKAFVHLDGVNDDWIERLEDRAAFPADRSRPISRCGSRRNSRRVGTPYEVATCCAPTSRVEPRPGPSEETMIANSQ